MTNRVQVAITAAAVSIVLALAALLGLVDSRVKVAIPDAPVVDISVEADAEGVTFSRTIAHDADGTWSVVYFLGNKKICEGSGADEYLKSEPRTQRFSHDWWANDKNCRDLGPGHYTINTEWAWVARDSGATTTESVVVTFDIETPAALLDH